MNSAHKKYSDTKHNKCNQLTQQKMATSPINVSKMKESVPRVLGRFPFDRTDRPDGAFGRTNSITHPH